MREHLTKKEMDLFKTSKMSVDELLRFDEHLSSCPECRSAIFTGEEFARFSGAVLSGHLTYRQLEGYLDDKLSPDDLRMVRRHIKECDECSDDVQSLSAAPPPARETGSATSLIERLFARPVLVFATLAIVAAAGVAVWFISTRTSVPAVEQIAEVQPPETLPEPPPSGDSPPAPLPETSETLVVSAIDGGRTVGVTGKGELTGYDALGANYRGIVKDALVSGRLPVPNMADLKGADGVLMGDPVEPGDRFRLTAPVGKVVDGASTELVWESLPGAKGYVVEVFDTGYNKVASSGEITSNRWTTTLARGRTYVWQVTAAIDGGVVKSPVPPAPEARFRVLDAVTSNGLAALRRTYPRSHLVLGIAFAQAGLIDDARRELRLAAKDNPGNDLPGRLLRQLR